MAFDATRDPALTGIRPVRRRVSGTLSRGLIFVKWLLSSRS